MKTLPISYQKNKKKGVEKSLTKGYEIVVDSREGLPLFTSKQETMKVGDYSFKTITKNYKEEFAIERKSGADLCQTLTTGHTRFRKELEKAKAYKYFAIVIEEPYTNLLTESFTGAKFGKTSGHTILKILFTLHVKYGINIFLTQNRAESKCIIMELTEAYIRNLSSEEKTK